MNNKNLLEKSPINKLKLLIFVGFFYPRIGGVETVVLNLIKNLARKGFDDIVIITKKHKENLPDLEIIEGAKVYRISVSGNKLISLFNIWMWMIKNRKLILRSDLLQFHDQNTFLWHIPLIFYRKPKFILFHGYDMPLPVRLRYKILRWVISKLVDDYSCVGKYLENYYPIKSRNVFYNGIEKMPDKTKKTKDICFVARIEEDTHLIDYLKSLVYLKKKYKLNPKLDVYGDGRLRNQCEDFAKQNKLDVNFKGWVPNADKVIAQYRYTFATQYLTTLNAMASESLAFNMALSNLKKDIAEDFLQKGKYGIICSDYKDLAEKFYYYNKNKKEYKKITKRSFDYSKLFLWDKVVEKTFIPVYNKLLK